jgi:hypothetical protein
MRGKILVRSLTVLTFLGCLAGLPGTIDAASIDEIVTQVNAYKASGEIRDADLASSLGHILIDAKYRESAGDLSARNDFLESFKDTVTSNNGDLITSAAATKLLGMTP